MQRMPQTKMKEREGGVARPRKENMGSKAIVQARQAGTQMSAHANTRTRQDTCIQRHSHRHGQQGSHAYTSTHTMYMLTRVRF